MNLFEDVGQFNRRFNLPESAWTGGSRKCHALTAEEFQYRLSFMREELDEFSDAFSNNDQAAMLDALVDLAYVVLGTAHYMGAPFNEAWRMVHQANMQKVLKRVQTDGVGAGTETEHKRGSIEVIRKPLGWKPPDLAALLAEASAAPEPRQAEDKNY